MTLMVANNVIGDHEELLQTKVGTRFYYAEKQLDIAVIGQLLLISGTNETLDAVRDISLSLLVDDIHAYKAWLLEKGALLRQDITSVPTGFNMLIQHPDATVMEYVEHSHAVHV